MIIAPFLCDLRIDEDGGMKIQMMSFPCRGIPRQGKEVMNHQIISHQRLCNPHCLRLYLMVLGLLALWEGRSEVVLGCLGALLTLSGYGERHDGKRKQKQQLPVVAGWGLLMYAAVSCFC